MYLSKRNVIFVKRGEIRFHKYLTGVCVVIVTLLLTSTKVSQVNNRKSGFRLRISLEVTILSKAASVFCQKNSVII